MSEPADEHQPEVAPIEVEAAPEPVPPPPEPAPAEVEDPPAETASSNGAGSVCESPVDGEPPEYSTDKAWSDYGRGLIQSLRVSAQTLQKQLKAIADTADIADPGARRAALAAAVERAQRKRDECAPSITHRLAELERSIVKAPSLGPGRADTVARIRAGFCEVFDEWPVDVASSAAGVNGAGAGLDEVVFECAIVTLPKRLNEHLAGNWTGNALSFDEAFADELPTEEQRIKFIKYLTLDPALVDGAIEPTNRLIYRYSPNPVWRALSCAIPLLALLGGAGLLIILSQLDEWGLASDDYWSKKWHLANGRALLGTYLFVAAGALFHLGVEAWKRTRDRGALPIFVAARGVIWLHLRSVALSLGVLFILVTTLGLHAISKDDTVTALFAGYGIDSIAGLFLTRFDSAATNALTALKKVVKPV